VLVAPAQEADVGASVQQVREGVGGLILFGASAPTDLGTQIAALTSQARGGIAPFVMTDEEGGAIQRLESLVGPVPSARQMAATMTPSQIRRLATTVGRRLAAAGVTMDLAPVLDLDDGAGPSSTDPDGTRSFGMDPTQTSADGLAFAAGLRAAGVVAVVKHFPGLGSATGNTDNGPASTLPWSLLRRAGLQPFRDAVAAGIPAVMVANATVPGLTALPASISPVVTTTLLRHRLGFTGLVMTDSVSAHALGDIGYPVPQAAVAALAAGTDLVLFGTGVNDDPRLTHQTVHAITAAVADGSLSRDTLVAAASRVLAAKGVDLCS
jgi:beta-N-acetylhexosaminidase